MPLLCAGLCPFFGLYQVGSFAAALQSGWGCKIPPLLPLDELSVTALECWGAVAVWLIPCREIYCTLLASCWRKQSQMILSKMRMFGQAVGAVISFAEDEQSCRTEPQVTPWISNQPLTLNFKIQRKEPKNQLGNWRLLVPSSALVRGNTTPPLSFSGGT